MSHFIVRHVPSGSYRTSRHGNVVFQAHLGTCVGVAIYDKKAGVGGMIHILLPEPVERSTPANPEKYASTGLMLLIRELYDMGAKAASMVATVAGGALVGPVTHQDINLDIGGRSSEIAMKILCSEGIKIENVETGGFFTCTLELNFKTGVASIKPAWSGSHDELSGETSMDDINRTMEKLMPIPQTALKILRLVQQDYYTLEMISNELKKDQVLSGRAIQMCNSAMFGGKIRIDTVKDALLILGEATLVNSVIAAAISSYFSQSDAMGYSLCRGGMFFHSLGCAVTTEIIAEITGKANPKAAYTAGLLHDIGKVVLDQHIACRYPLFYRELHLKQSDSIAVESRVLGTNHCETGRALADNWQFANSLSDVILYHHTPHLSSEINSNLVRLVYLADLIISKFHSGVAPDRVEAENFEEIITSLGLTTSDIPAIIDAIPKYVFDLDC